MSPTNDRAVAFPAEPRCPLGRDKTGELDMHKRASSMYKKLILGLAVLSVVAVAPLLSACHTTAGAGQDISVTGNAITNSAEKHTP